MSYQKAIEATGVEVKSFNEFGSYQGTWIAHLSDGRVIEGSYGSCSGCDAFQAEFSYFDEPHAEDGKFFRERWSEDEITEDEYNQIVADNKKKLSDFGQSYVNEAQTLSEAISRYENKCAEEYAWDDDKEILEYLKTLA